MSHYQIQGPHPSMIGSYCHLLSRGHKTHFITFVSPLESPSFYCCLLSAQATFLTYYYSTHSAGAGQDARTLPRPNMIHLPPHNFCLPLVLHYCLAVVQKFCLGLWRLVLMQYNAKAGCFHLSFSSSFAVHLSISECTQNKVIGTILCKNGPLPSLAGYYPNYPNGPPSL